jgi:hypothetical protein
LFIALTIVELTVLLVILVQLGSELKNDSEVLIPAQRVIVQRLELTDLSIWTEARYTRHPSQADFFSPFQDGPSSFDLFPAGSVVVAPGRRAARGSSGP